MAWIHICTQKNESGCTFFDEPTTQFVVHVKPRSMLSDTILIGRVQVATIINLTIPLVKPVGILRTKTTTSTDLVLLDPSVERTICMDYLAQANIVKPTLLPEFHQPGVIQAGYSELVRFGSDGHGVSPRHATYNQPKILAIVSLSP